MRDKTFRNRSLARLWNRDYAKYRKMIDRGYEQDTKTGEWRYVGRVSKKEIDGD